jgi:hypothetical protein
MLRHVDEGICIVGRGGRVVFLSSRCESLVTDKAVFESYMSGGGKGLSASAPKEKDHHDPLEKFAVASHATALTTFALNRALREQGGGCQVRACVVSPGRVRTGFLGLGGRIFGKSPGIAADSVVWAATSPEALECMQKGVDEPFFSPGILQSTVSIIIIILILITTTNHTPDRTHLLGSLVCGLVSLTFWGACLLSRVYLLKPIHHDDSVCNWRMWHESFWRSEHIP